LEASWLLVVISLFCWVLQVDQVVRVSVFFSQKGGVVLFNIAPLESVLLVDLLQVLEVVVEGAGLRIYKSVAENQLLVF
jgi:hypothetical protein